MQLSRALKEIVKRYFVKFVCRLGSGIIEIFAPGSYSLQCRLQGGLADGGSWNSKFFKKSSKKAPWVGQNEVTGGDIYWKSDYPHMIKS